MAPPEEKIAIVGAGPVGSLAALYAAQRGYQVELYELRPGKTDHLIFDFLHHVRPCSAAVSVPLTHPCDWNCFWNSC